VELFFPDIPGDPLDETVVVLRSSFIYAFAAGAGVAPSRVTIVHAFFAQNDERLADLASEARATLREQDIQGPFASGANDTSRSATNGSAEDLVLKNSSSANATSSANSTSSGDAGESGASRNRGLAMVGAGKAFVLEFAVALSPLFQSDGDPGSSNSTGLLSEASNQTEPEEAANDTSRGLGHAAGPNTTAAANGSTNATEFSKLVGTNVSAVSSRLRRLGASSGFETNSSVGLARSLIANAADITKEMQTRVNADIAKDTRLRANVSPVSVRQGVVLVTAVLSDGRSVASDLVAGGSSGGSSGKSSFLDELFEDQLRSHSDDEDEDELFAGGAWGAGQGNSGQRNGSLFGNNTGTSSLGGGGDSGGEESSSDREIHGGHDLPAMLLDGSRVVAAAEIGYLAMLTALVSMLITFMAGAAIIMIPPETKREIKREVKRVIEQSMAFQSQAVRKVRTSMHHGLQSVGLRKSTMPKRDKGGVAVSPRPSEMDDEELFVDDAMLNAPRVSMMPASGMLRALGLDGFCAFDEAEEDAFDEDGEVG